MAKSIAFIICVNDETYYEECLFYIKRLKMPKGYALEVWPVRQALSIYQGYNMAMLNSDAEYKIYMHQDVFLIEPDILLKFIGLFENRPWAGIAGLLGADGICADRRFYRGWNLGNVIGCSEKKAFCNHLSEGLAKAAAVDGMFMMTREDIAWRGDVLSGWDFYDISQSMEFRQRGYELWVLAGERPWCIHDCGYLNLTGYDRAMESFLELYREFLPDYSGQAMVYPEQYRRRFNQMAKLKEQWKALLFLGKKQEVRTAIAQVWDERFADTEAVILKNILEILQEEELQGYPAEKSFLYDCGSFKQALQKYLKVKFYLRRTKYAPDDAGAAPAASKAAERVIYSHTML